MQAAVPVQSDTTARRALHEHAIGLHDALDALQADDALRELDWPLEGANALLVLAVDRFEQIRRSLEVYGRTTPPAPIPLSSDRRAA